MKTLLLIPLFAALNLYSQSRSEAMELYRLRGETSGNALKGAEAFESLAKNETEKLEKCFLLNKAAYLKFFHGSQLSDEKQETVFLEQSLSLSNQCRDLFMSEFNINTANKLNDDEKQELAMALYQGGTSLARVSEIKGTTTALKNWPEIRKRMNFIIEMQQSPVANYGAHRTLGIANTKMPSPFGNKNKAKKYLTLSVNKTLWNSRRVSLYLFNSISLGEFYFKTKKKPSACAILKEVNEITPEEMKKENPDLYYENVVDQKRSLKLFNEFNC